MGAASTALILGSAKPAFARDLASPPPIADHPFTLGVASGDPLHNAVVLWTRLAPNPTDGGGMAPFRYPVSWEIATDEAMGKVIRRGRQFATPEHAHSVHVDARGLAPGREYFYRFRVGDHLSPIGRTRTAPAPGRRAAQLQFGLVSCQRYNSGWYTAYDDLVAHDPELVVHVGDYIYETGGSGVRSDPLPESISLDQYRNRYGLYKSEPSLIAAHQQAPWLFTWDDHEIENNYASSTPEVGSATPDPVEFRARRAAASKAYWEHMPFRLPAPTSADFRLHRQIRWGRLAEFFVLDTRQYRADQCGEIGPPCDPAPDSTRPMLGDQQEQWLADGLSQSRAAWSVLAQQVVFSKLDFAPGESEIFNLDQWDGYRSARQRVLDTMRRHRPHDNIVLTGDIHASGVSDVLANYDDPSSAKLGAEFVGTSISSAGNALLGAILPALLLENPHLKWGDASKRGWVKHTVTDAEWRADYRHVDNATVPGSPVQTATSWVVPRGGAVTSA